MAAHSLVDTAVRHRVGHRVLHVLYQPQWRRARDCRCDALRCDSRLAIYRNHRRVSAAVRTDDDALGRNSADYALDLDLLRALLPCRCMLAAGRVDPDETA